MVEHGLKKAVVCVVQGLGPSKDPTDEVVEIDEDLLRIPEVPPNEHVVAAEPEAEHLPRTPESRASRTQSQPTKRVISRVINQLDWDADLSLVHRGRCRHRLLRRLAFKEIFLT
jgi:hypothetical protein